MNSNEDTLTASNEHCIDVCSGLLRDELAAVETYSKAINQHAGSRVIDGLRRIRADHSRSVTLLSMKVRALGGRPVKDSRAWKLAAGLFGRNSAIESLQRGEEKCRSNYLAALLDDEVMTSCKQLIREELLPPVIGHITALDRLEHAV